MHSVADNDDDDSVTGKRSAALLLGLPDELAEWADQNQQLVADVHKALASSYASLTPEQVWEAIATASRDTEWLEARQGMQAAEKMWNDRNHPANAPLGAIGAALDSHETDSAREQYAFSLAHFTIINEGLMQRRPDLARLLNVLLVLQRMVKQSTDVTQRVKEAAKNMAELTSPLRHHFRRAAKRPSPIYRQFKKVAQQLLTPAKQPLATNVTVPWSPGI